MKIYISYFYQIRFFTSNIIPLSTCVSDPSYFHNFTGNKKYKFKDKRGVWNGLRAEPFVPDDTCKCLCRGPEFCDTHNPDECGFLRHYYIQLQHLDFNEMISRFERLGKTVQKNEGFFEEPIVILLVHEAPDNPCSERWPLIEWFAAHGYELEEWNHG